MTREEALSELTAISEAISAATLTPGRIRIGDIEVESKMQLIHLRQRESELLAYIEALDTGSAKKFRVLV